MVNTIIAAPNNNLGLSMPPLQVNLDNNPTASPSTSSLPVTTLKLDVDDNRDETVPELSQRAPPVHFCFIVHGHQGRPTGEYR